MHLLGLRAAFKLSIKKTTVASMVRGSLVKNPCDEKEIPRLLCHLATEEFVTWNCGNAIIILEWNARLGNKPAARQIFLEMLQGFGDIFVDGLCVHHRSLRTTHDKLFDTHWSLRGIGIILTSTPVAAAMTRRLKNYGERRNDYCHMKQKLLARERLNLFVEHNLRERGVSVSAVHRSVSAM